jgi:hypothetical protein
VTKILKRLFVAPAHSHEEVRWARGIGPLVIKRK